MSASARREALYLSFPLKASLSALWWYVGGPTSRAREVPPATLQRKWQRSDARHSQSARALGVLLAKNRKGHRLTLARVLGAFNVDRAHGKQSLAVQLECGASTAQKTLQGLATRRLISKSGRNWKLTAAGSSLAGESARLAA